MHPAQFVSVDIMHGRLSWNTRLLNLAIAGSMVDRWCGGDRRGTFPRLAEAIGNDKVVDGCKLLPPGALTTRRVGKFVIFD